MKKVFSTIMLVIIVIGLVACSMDNNNTAENETNDSEELKTLEVDFEVPETADVNDSVKLKATVSYGDEMVTDADEVVFEIWQQGHEEESIMLETTNNEDGTYTAETTFENDGVYEMYAHTTARDLHTMPKKSITVGTGKNDQEAENHEEGHDHGHHTEGFGLHFVEPENVNTDSETDLIVHLQMDGNPLEEANVRYEIWNNEVSDKHDWIDAEEIDPGEYTATHLFTESGTYHIQVHVENDDGLHEHKEYEVLVND